MNQYSGFLICSIDGLAKISRIIAILLLFISLQLPSLIARYLSYIASLCAPWNCQHILSAVDE